MISLLNSHALAGGSRASLVTKLSGDTPHELKPHGYLFTILTAIAKGHGRADIKKLLP
ncbi:hypothetical protein [Pseudopelagicola sp. nBUS_19]|uniref:hypothetical protein n=1 Tax=unclassified Pseudopelagicola TaxID=2649563 RepID=UPI003EB70FB1